jgi:preprotein translocase subunit YajC
MNFISQAHAQAAGQASGGFDVMQLALMVGLFVMFYFIAIRPQRKRQKEHKTMVSSLAKGDEVVTSSGILGKITKLEDDYLSLNVAENVELKFQRHSIHAVLPKGTLKQI